MLNKDTNLISAELISDYSDQRIEELVYDTVVEQYEAKIKRAEEERIDFKATERNLLLRQVDSHWKDHIAAMDQLRKGIGLRGLGQRDPVMEYRREGFEMFDNMIEDIQNRTATVLAKIDIEAVIERKNIFIQEQLRRVTIRNTDPAKSIGRNDPCPCGSGRKYKNCCGK